MGPQAQETRAETAARQEQESAAALELPAAGEETYATILRFMQQKELEFVYDQADKQQQSPTGLAPNSTLTHEQLQLMYDRARQWQAQHSTNDGRIRSFILRVRVLLKKLKQ